MPKESKFFGVVITFRLSNLLSWGGPENGFCLREKQSAQVSTQGKRRQYLTKRLFCRNFCERTEAGHRFCPRLNASPPKDLGGCVPEKRQRRFHPVNTRQNAVFSKSTNAGHHLGTVFPRLMFFAEISRGKTVPKLGAEKRRPPVLVRAKRMRGRF